MLSRINIFRFAVFLFLILKTFPITQRFLPHDYAIPIFLLISVSVTFYPKAFINKQTFMLLIYLGILCIFTLLGHPRATFGWVLFEVLHLFLSLCIFNVIIYNHDIYVFKAVAFVGTLIILITILLTLGILENAPKMVRMMVVSDTDVRFYYNRLGIITFGSIHALPFLFPVLIGNTKSYIRYRNKMLIPISTSLMVIVVFYLMILKSAFTIALLLSSFSIIMSIFISNDRTRNIILFLVLSFMFLSPQGRNLTIGAINTAINIPIISHSYSKFIDIVDSIAEGSPVGQASGRTKLTTKSFNTFFKSPMYGSFSKVNAGGHSYFIDRLAYFGLLGSIPFFMFYYYVLRAVYFFIEIRLRPYYMLCILVFIFLSTFQNIIGIENTLYLFILFPGLSLFSTTVRITPEKAC